MKQIHILLIFMALLCFSACQEKDPFKYFHQEHTEEEKARFLENYSLANWDDNLEKVITNPVGGQVDTLIERYGDKTIDLALMKSKYGEPDSHDILQAKKGNANSILGIESPWHWFYLLRPSKDCILERYVWKLESGEGFQIIYLRKGKELYPIDGAWDEDGFISWE